MTGKPFQSKLTPHFALISELRHKHQSWQEIVAHLATLGLTTDKGSVCAFFKRHRRRPAPLGMEVDTPKPSRFVPPIPSVEWPELTESTFPPSEFDTIPLTRSTKKKWGILPPN